MAESDSTLSRIRGPEDIKALSGQELSRLAFEIRESIISTVKKNGGHLASNLGVVELTIALHAVFDSPRDKIVWDVGHQCYAHKLLTGRFAAFSTLRRMGGLAGFPKRDESPHDVFNTGHASTSVSAALGILAGERIRGTGGMAVAVIGDGALTGGIAYEALSHAGQLGFPLVVILNDNKMSIGPNVGGLSKYLSRLSMKAKYQLFRRTFDAMVQAIPVVGEPLYTGILRLKRAVKAVFYTDNFFVDLGFEYVGPIGGHRISALTRVFRDVKKLGRPVVIHVMTRKGKGYGDAEEDPGTYHGVSAPPVPPDPPVSPGSAASPGQGVPPLGGGAPPGGGERGPSFTEVFGRLIRAAAERDPLVTAVTAAMEKGTGLAAFKRAFPDRFFDAGIAEEHALTFACALASQGLKAVAAIYSTFIQRGVDQVIHDAALQKLPVILALDRAGFVGEDGETHQGLFDISLFRPVPGMRILAPAGAAELGLMLDWALAQGAVPGGPIAIRYPKDRPAPDMPAFSQPLAEGRGVWVRSCPEGETLGEGTPEGETLEKAGAGGPVRICLAFTGGLCGEALRAADILGGRGFAADCYNLRFLKPVDEEYLAAIMDRYSLTLFAEEGIREGGFGEYALALAQRRNCGPKVLSLAVEGDFVGLGTRRELLRANRLDGEGIADYALSWFCRGAGGSRNFA